MKDYNFKFLFQKKILRLLILIYFLIPYIIFFKYFSLHLNIDKQEFFWALKNSLIQSCGTALLVTILSIPLSLGLLQAKGKYAKWLNHLLLIPQILPALFSILIAFMILQPFPMGSIGIIFIFSLVHLGFSIVLLTSATKEKLSSYAVVSQIYGVKRLVFFRKVYFPLLRSDLLTNFMLIFVFCFSSFSIPLMAGGGLGTNLEVLIYEKIFINQDWSTAWTLSLLQSFIIFCLSIFVLKNKWYEKNEFSIDKYLKSKLGLGLVFIYLLTYLGGYLFGVVNSFIKINSLSEFFVDMLPSTLKSLEILTTFLAVSFLLLFLWIYDFIFNTTLNLAKNLISPSTVLVGFSFYLFFPTTADWDYLKISLAMSILFFPSLFKSFLEKPLMSLRNQIVVARLYGLSVIKIIIRVVLPQLGKPLIIWFSFLTVWFLSDFAIQKTLGTQTQTIGLVAAGFLNSYRLSLAYLASFYIILVWLLVLLFGFVAFEVLSVFNKKFKS